MLIGYDPNDGNKIKFVFTDTRYLQRMEKIMKRPLTVDDFWNVPHNLVSKHITDNYSAEYINKCCYKDGKLVLCEEGG